MSQVTQVYGGDEINAIVLEPGSAWTRVGWSAEDSPSISYSTYYAKKEGQNLYGEDQTHLARPNTDILNPMSDSIVADWDAAKGLWTTALSQASPERNTDFLSESPLLITEPFWNTSQNQIKQMQFALEELEVPATYIAKSPVMALFSAGRGTGIVVDVGEQSCSVTPVVDGFCLYKSANRSRRAGHFLTTKVRQTLTDLNDGEEIVSQYQVKSKKKVDLGAPASYTRKTIPDNITESFKIYQQNRVVENFKESVIVTSEYPLEDGKKIENIKGRVFEFPDGHSSQYGEIRYRLGEILFSQDSNCNKTLKDDTTTEKSDLMDVEVPGKDKPEITNPEQSTKPGTDWSNLGISSMIIDSLKSCDVDLRPNLANNIVVTGGVTLTQGFTERISQDLQREFPMMKIRLLASGNIVERKNGAWIGGSILASLGTFHQMWVTRQEFEEIGGEQLAKKRFR